MADPVELSDAAGARACGRCGAPFTCAMEAGGAAPCWCAALPHVAALPAAEGARCLCPGCLGEWVAGVTGRAGPKEFGDEV